VSNRKRKWRHCLFTAKHVLMSNSCMAVPMAWSALVYSRRYDFHACIILMCFCALSPLYETGQSGDIYTNVYVLEFSKYCWECLSTKTANTMWMPLVYDMCETRAIESKCMIQADHWVEHGKEYGRMSTYSIMTTFCFEHRRSLWLELFCTSFDLILQKLVHQSLSQCLFADRTLDSSFWTNLSDDCLVDWCAHSQIEDDPPVCLALDISLAVNNHVGTQTQATVKQPSALPMHRPKNRFHASPCLLLDKR